MNEQDSTRAEQDVINTTDSYGGPVSEEELAEVYLAPQNSDQGGNDGERPPGVASDPAKTDGGAAKTDEGGATPEGPATDVANRSN